MDGWYYFNLIIAYGGAATLFLGLFFLVKSLSKGLPPEEKSQEEGSSIRYFKDHKPIKRSILKDTYLKN